MSKQHHHVIADAAYFVYDNDPTIASPITALPRDRSTGRSPSNKVVTFYTSLGDALCRVRVADGRAQPLLDVQAPLPRPTSCRRVWLPGGGGACVLPCFAVLLHDKNGNRIGWAALPSADAQLAGVLGGRYDVSQLQEEEKDFSLFKPDDDNDDERCQKQRGESCAVQ
jgi:hypothetical protein